MRNIVIILLTVLITATAKVSAQSNSDLAIELRDSIAQKVNKFLTVKGIELKPGLTMVDFLHAIENKGIKRDEFFDFTKEKYDAYSLRGTFFRRQDCGIMVLPIANNKKIVGRIGIDFPEFDTFAKLSNLYYDLKSALQNKYHISSCTESFDKEYIKESSSDFVKLYALSEDQGLFETRFNVSDDELSFILGYIILKISHRKVNHETKYYVSLVYVTSDDTLEQFTSADDDL